MAYQPAGNLTTTPTMGHAQAIYYKKKGLARLQKKFIFQTACFDDELPLGSGRTAQWYRFSNLSAGTTPTVEGTPGTSLGMTSKVVGVSVSQFSDFISLSDMHVDTAIDKSVENASELLGYRAGLSLDTMVRTVIDNESANTNQPLLATFLKVADLRSSRHQLQAVDVPPFEDNEFLVITHPFASFDLVNDPAAGGLADIFKYTKPEETPLTKYEDRGVVTHIAGCKVVESTNTKTATGPNTYRTYVFGQGGVGILDLAGRGPTRVTDPTRKRFAIKVVYPQNQVADPEGLIRAFVSYNFVFGVAVVDGPSGIGGTYRYKTLDPQSSLG